MDSRTIALEAVKAAEKAKAEDSVILNLQGITLIADYFVLLTGRSSTQVQAIADSIEEMLTGQGVRLLRREGYQEARWILLDFGSVVVHVFRDEDRRFYSLERLWGDARVEEPEGREKA